MLANNMFIILNNRPDRLGSNLTWYIMQIVYAHHNGYFVHYHGSPHDSSIFVQAMVEYIDKYNYALGEKLGNHDHLYTEYFIEDSDQDWPGNNMKVCHTIQCDLLSYFKKHIYPDFSNILFEMIRESTQIFDSLSVVPFKKTIAVHLRLDDVVNRVPYNGLYSTMYYRERLERGEIGIDLENERIFFENRGIQIPGWGREYNPYDCQAPISEDLVTHYINMAREKYPTHEVVIVTSPLSTTTLPYQVIQSSNTDTDLLILAKADVLICSKSLFCFTSVYFSEATEIFIPMWGHIAGTGLTSQYDHTDNTTYLY